MILITSVNNVFWFSFACYNCVTYGGCVINFLHLLLFSLRPMPFLWTFPYTIWSLCIVVSKTIESQKS